MIINFITGDSGIFANTGSSIAAFNYLYLQNKENCEKGLIPESFFNSQDKEIDFSDMVKDIDQNKGHLSKKDAKFFVININPSAREQEAMGLTNTERSDNFKLFIKEIFIDEYAKSFSKGLTSIDIKWYGIIRHNRGKKVGNQMHAHIIVSRKDMANKIKLSPMTNHRASERSGTVKSGFNRSAFFETIEYSFDYRFQYNRDLSESFKYCNTMKRGSVEDKFNLLIEKANIQAEQSNIKEFESLESNTKLERLERMNFLKYKIRANSKFRKRHKS